MLRTETLFTKVIHMHRIPISSTKDTMRISLVNTVPGPRRSKPADPYSLFRSAPTISTSVQLFGTCYILAHVQMLRYLLTYIVLNRADPKVIQL